MKYKNGEIVTVKVTGVEKYGIFVNVDEEYKGLIHISEVSEGFVRNLNDFVSVGETIQARITGILEDNHQIKLSIKNLNYKNPGQSKIVQTKAGFGPLKDELDIWINEKLKK